MSEAYYMTLEEKAKEMGHWGELQSGPRGPAGHGFPDDLIIPLCDKINALSYVCTLQSCAGHDGSKEKWEYPGELWLWFDQASFHEFLRRAAQLAECPGIEQVSVLYGRYNDRRAVVSVMFHGMNKGQNALEKSAKTIMKFVEKVMPDGR